MQIYYIVLHGKQDKNEEKSEKVIDGLKKYNRSMIILKIIVVMLSIFIFFTWRNLIVKCVKESIETKENYEKGQYLFDIMDKAYSALDEITNTNNYSLVEETTSISYDFNIVHEYIKKERFYKDGYFKEVSTGDLGSIETIHPIDLNYMNYGVVTQDKTFYIHIDDGYSDCGITTSYATNETMHNILELYRKENVLEYEDFEIREEKIDKNTYYIISKNENKSDGKYCTEIWINKDNMQLSKFTNEKIGCKKTELKFTLSEGDVRDEDVRLNFAGENEKLQELGKLFEKINNDEFEDNYEQVIKWDNNNDNSKVFFTNYSKSNKKVITQAESIDIINDKYEKEAGYGYRYQCMIFDQNGDAYYVWRQFQGTDTFVQNTFVSIFGDTIKTNNMDVELKNGDLVIL